MFRLFAHCWLILSLLVAPVQFATADIAVLDHGQAKCAMMDMQDHDMAGMGNGSMDHDMSGSGCQCPDQCKVSCAGAHLSLALNSTLRVPNFSSSTSLDTLSTSIRGIDQLTELRPPKLLHA